MSTPTHLLQQASLALSAGRLSAAEQALRRLLKMLPRNAQAHALMVRLYAQRGEYLSAASHQQRLCNLQPQAPSHWVRLVHWLNLAGEPERAQAALQGAAEVGLDMSLLQRLEAQLAHPPLLRQQILLSQYQQASDALTCEIAAHLFISDYPDHPLGWQILGALQHDAGRLEEALQTKKQTVQRFAHDANAWNNLAHTQLALGQAQDALQSADKALSLEPCHASAAACRQQASTQIASVASSGAGPDLASGLGT